MSRQKLFFTFEFREVKLTLPIGGKHTFNDGDVLTVKKYNPKWNDTMEMLWCNINGGNWFGLEKGKRTSSGKERIEFNIAS